LTGEENGEAVRHAVEHHRIIVTFDRDFLELMNLDERVRVVRIAVPQRKAMGAIQKVVKAILSNCSRLDGRRFVEITEEQLGSVSS